MPSLSQRGAVCVGTSIHRFVYLRFAFSYVAARAFKKEGALDSGRQTRPLVSSLPRRDLALEGATQKKQRTTTNIYIYIYIYLYI